MSDTNPRFVPIWLACKQCGHWWDDFQPTNVPCETWIAQVQNYHCPNCGGDIKCIAVRAQPLAERPA